MLFLFNVFILLISPGPLRAEVGEKPQERAITTGGISGPTGAFLARMSVSRALNLVGAYGVYEDPYEPYLKLRIQDGRNVAPRSLIDVHDRNGWKAGEVTEVLNPRNGITVLEYRLLNTPSGKASHYRLTLLRNNEIRETEKARSLNYLPGSEVLKRQMDTDRRVKVLVLGEENAPQVFIEGGWYGEGLVSEKPIAALVVPVSGGYRIYRGKVAYESENPREFIIHVRNYKGGHYILVRFKRRPHFAVSFRVVGKRSSPIPELMKPIQTSAIQEIDYEFNAETIEREFGLSLLSSDI